MISRERALELAEKSEKMVDRIMSEIIAPSTPATWLIAGCSPKPSPSRP
jgi:hypothetical protein